MIHDDDNAVRKEEEDPRNTIGPTEQDADMDLSLDGDSLISDEANESPETNLYNLRLEIDNYRDALEVMPRSSPGPKRVLSLVLGRMTECDGFGTDMDEWVDPMAMSPWNVFRTAKWLTESGLV